MDDPLLSLPICLDSPLPPLFSSPPIHFLSPSLLASLSRSLAFPQSVILYVVSRFCFFSWFSLRFVLLSFVFRFCLSCICSCVRIFVLFITHRLVEVSSTIGRNLDTTRDRRRKHRLARRICLRILCHRHHHHCHHSHSPIRTHCPVVVGRGAGFPSCSGSDA